MKHVSSIALIALLLSSCGQSVDTANISKTDETNPMPKESPAQIVSIESKVTQALAKATELKRLNAFIHLDEKGARAQARILDQQQDKQGSLHGMLLAIKDNIHVAGLPNTAGTPALKRFVPLEDNLAVQRLKDAGAIVLGKANMHELAFGITSDNPAFGSVRNPVDESKFAGGSSGGTAAAIAAGIVDAGLGTDTGGSTRIPAALTGVTGFRPSIGRYPGDAITPVSQSRDTIGPLARSVQGLIDLDAVITGESDPVNAVDLSTIRLGIDQEYYLSQLDSDTALRVDQSLKALERAGVTIVPAKVPQLGELLAQSGFPIVFYEVIRELPEYLEKYDTGISFAQLQQSIASEDVKGAFSGATGSDTAVPDSVYENALDAKAEISKNFAHYFAEHKLDAMIFPTTKLPARDIEGSLNTVELNGAQVPTFPSYIHNTDPASLAGIPAVSLPAGVTSTGLPVGIELDGPVGSDRQLLGIALAIEELFSSTEK